MSRSERGPVRERLVPGENLTEVAVIDGSSIAAVRGIHKREEVPPAVAIRVDGDAPPHCPTASTRRRVVRPWTDVVEREVDVADRHSRDEPPGLHVDAREASATCVERGRWASPDRTRRRGMGKTLELGSCSETWRRCDAECRNDERSHKYYTPHTLTSPLIALIVLSRQFSGDLPPLDSADRCLDEPADTDGMPPHAPYAAGTPPRPHGTSP